MQFCEEMADAGKVVVVNALNSTFQRQPFDIVSRLLAVSEKITHLSAVCTSCSRDAAFTKRTVESQELQLIGGSEAYVAVCRSCFKESEKK